MKHRNLRGAIVVIAVGAIVPLTMASAANAASGSAGPASAGPRLTAQRAEQPVYIGKRPGLVPSRAVKPRLGAQATATTLTLSPSFTPPASHPFLPGITLPSTDLTLTATVTAGSATPAGTLDIFELITGATVATFPISSSADQTFTYTAPVSVGEYVFIAEFTPTDSSVQAPSISDFIIHGVDYSSACERLVDNLYRDILGREADSAGLQHFSGSCSSELSTAQQAAVATRLANSAEGYRVAVNNLYEEALGRDADPTGAAFWANTLARGGHEQTVLAQLLGSPEFYTSADNDRAEFVQGLYEIVLGRGATADDEDFWVARVSAVGRTAVALAIINSAESADITVTGAYEGLLARDPDASGLALRVRALRGGADVKNLLLALVASPEFAALAQPNS